MCTIRRVSSQEYVIFRIILNEEDKGEYFCLLSPEQEVLLKRRDMKVMGLRDDIGSETVFDHETYVALDSIDDLDYLIREDVVSLEITAAPHLFGRHIIDARFRKSFELQYPGTASAFFNYNGTLIDESEGSYFDLSGELGISAGDYFGRTTFSYHKEKDEENAVRLETSLMVNDREHLRTAILGDVPAQSGVLGSGSLLGGINLSKNFSLDPYYVRFPSLDLKGTLDTPSEVEVYLDGMLVKRERLSPGEFVFHDVPATIGLGNGEIIIHDAFGGERIITKPYYYSDRLLKKGLHEYSYSIGFMREDFGEKSFSYGRAAFLGFHNYGYSPNLTIGYSAEASRDVINIGPSVSVLLSRAGTLDIAAAMSRSDGKYGLSGLVSYIFQSKYINARVALRSDSREYSTLRIEPSDDKVHLYFDASIGVGLRKAGSFTVAYTQADMHSEQKRRRALISYNRAITETSTLFINGSETKGSETNHEILIGLHIYFGKDISGNISYRGTEGADEKRMSLQKSLPAGTGYGFRADYENARSYNNYGGSLQYQNDYGIYKAGYSNRQDNERSLLSVSGGIGYIDGSFFLSRPILDSFAKVKVGELEGVRTYYYGNEVGRTDSSGEVILPNLHAFYENKIDIEAQDIPINYSIRSMTRYITPPFRSGSLINFDVRRIQGTTGTLFHSVEGKEVPVEYGIMRIETEEGMIEGLVGKEGEFYLENMPQGEHTVNVTFGDNRCLLNLNIPDSKDILIDMGKVACQEHQ